MSSGNIVSNADTLRIDARIELEMVSGTDVSNLFGGKIAMISGNEVVVAEKALTHLRVDRFGNFFLLEEELVENDGGGFEEVSTKLFLGRTVSAYTSISDLYRVSCVEEDSFMRDIRSIHVTSESMKDEKGVQSVRKLGEIIDEITQVTVVKEEETSFVQGIMDYVTVHGPVPHGVVVAKGLGGGHRSFLSRGQLHEEEIGLGKRFVKAYVLNDRVRFALSVEAKDVVVARGSSWRTKPGVLEVVSRMEEHVASRMSEEWDNILSRAGTRLGVHSAEVFSQAMKAPHVDWPVMCAPRVTIGDVMLALFKEIEGVLEAIEVNGIKGKVFSLDEIEQGGANEFGMGASGQRTGQIFSLFLEGGKIKVSRIEDLARNEVNEYVFFTREVIVTSSKLVKEQSEVVEDEGDHTPLLGVYSLRVVTRNQNGRVKSQVEALAFYEGMAPEWMPLGSLWSFDCVASLDFGMLGHIPTRDVVEFSVFAAKGSVIYRKFEQGESVPLTVEVDDFFFDSEAVKGGFSLMKVDSGVSGFFIENTTIGKPMKDCGALRCLLAPYLAEGAFKKVLDLETFCGGANFEEFTANSKLVFLSGISDAETLFPLVRVDRSSFGEKKVEATALSVPGFGIALFVPDEFEERDVDEMDFDIFCPISVAPVDQLACFSLRGTYDAKRTGFICGLLYCLQHFGFPLRPLRKYFGLWTKVGLQSFVETVLKFIRLFSKTDKSLAVAYWNHLDNFQLVSKTLTPMEMMQMLGLKVSEVTLGGARAVLKDHLDFLVNMIIRPLYEVPDLYDDSRHLLTTSQHFVERREDLYLEIIAKSKVSAIASAVASKPKKRVSKPMTPEVEDEPMPSSKRVKTVSLPKKVSKLPAEKVAKTETLEVIDVSDDSECGSMGDDQFGSLGGVGENDEITFITKCSFVGGRITDRTMQEWETEVLDVMARVHTLDGSLADGVFACQRPSSFNEEQRAALGFHDRVLLSQIENQWAEASQALVGVRGPSQQLPDRAEVVKCAASLLNHNYGVFERFEVIMRFAPPEIASKYFQYMDFSSAGMFALSAISALDHAAKVHGICPVFVKESTVVDGLGVFRAPSSGLSTFLSNYLGVYRWLGPAERSDTEVCLETRFSKLGSTSMGLFYDGHSDYVNFLSHCAAELSTTIVGFSRAGRVLGPRAVRNANCASIANHDEKPSAQLVTDDFGDKTSLYAKSENLPVNTEIFVHYGGRVNVDELTSRLEKQLGEEIFELVKKRDLAITCIDRDQELPDGFIWVVNGSDYHFYPASEFDLIQGSQMLVFLDKDPQSTRSALCTLAVLKDVSPFVSSTEPRTLKTVPLDGSAVMLVLGKVNKEEAHTITWDGKKFVEKKF